MISRNSVRQAARNPGDLPVKDGHAAGVQQILLDSFTDTNGVLLQNHDPDIDLSGNGWVLRFSSGTGQKIQANQLQGDAFTYTTHDTGETLFLTKIDPVSIGGTNQECGQLGYFTYDGVSLSTFNLLGVYIDNSAGGAPFKGWIQEWIAGTGFQRTSKIGQDSNPVYAAFSNGVVSWYNSSKVLQQSYNASGTYQANGVLGIYTSSSSAIVDDYSAWNTDDINEVP